MSQTALNLTAIAIFTMTIFSLVGPLVNLSPTIPAIAVFGLLGVATLDNFTWKGQGSNLILDWLASFSPTHRERIVRHEAGHFLIAYLLEIPVTAYALSAWEAFKQGQSAFGGVSFSDQEIASELAQGSLSSRLLDRYCTVWMAGIAAETLVYGQAEGGADDRQKLTAVLMPLGFSPTALQQKQRWATLQAKTLLQENWATYETLVQAMEQRTSVEECYRLIQQNLLDFPSQLD